MTKVELYYVQEGTPPPDYAEAVSSAQDFLIALIGAHTRLDEEPAPNGGLAFGRDRGNWAEHVLLTPQTVGVTPEFALEWCGRFRREKLLAI